MPLSRSLTIALITILPIAAQAQMRQLDELMNDGANQTIIDSAGDNRITTSPVITQPTTPITEPVIAPTLPSSNDVPITQPSITSQPEVISPSSTITTPSTSIIAPTQGLTGSSATSLPNSDILKGREERRQQYQAGREAWERQQSIQRTQAIPSNSTGFGTDRSPDLISNTLSSPYGAIKDSESDIAPIAEPTNTDGTKESITNPVAEPIDTTVEETITPIAEPLTPDVTPPSSTQSILSDDSSTTGNISIDPRIGYPTLSVDDNMPVNMFQESNSLSNH